MPLITSRPEVLATFAEATARRWVIPALGTENLTTSEAVLSAALLRAQETNCPNLPVMLAVTNRYPERTQSAYYTHTRDWRTGLELLLADLAVLAGPHSPFCELRIMLHLDHIQHDLDEQLWRGDLRRFSSIMFDASTLPFEENLRQTREFVAVRGSEIVIEGACDYVGGKDNRLTETADALRFARETGVDWIVPNLGTEHRAGSSVLRYAGEQARKLRDAVGSMLVLHGASSVAPDQLGALFEDGIIKVNLWTALERDASARLLEEMVTHAAKVGGPTIARHLVDRGLLGAAADLDSAPALSHFTTAWRQELVFESMKQRALAGFRVWYPVP